MNDHDGISLSEDWAVAREVNDLRTVRRWLVKQRLLMGPDDRLAGANYIAAVEKQIAEKATS